MKSNNPQFQEIHLTNAYIYIPSKKKKKKTRILELWLILVHLQGHLLLLLGIFNVLCFKAPQWGVRKGALCYFLTS